MSAPSRPAGERSPAAALQLGRVQVAYAGVALLVGVVSMLVHEKVWTHPATMMGAAAIVGATALAVFGERRRAWARWARIVVPTLDLLAITVFISEDDIPRIIAMLAVVPALWLGIAGRRAGIVVVVVAGAAAGSVMAMHLPGSSGVVLTANAVGAVLAPLALSAAAWFGHTFASTIERQQRALLQREREKLAIAKDRAADAALLDAIFETVRVGLLLLDADGRLVRANSALSGHAVLGGDDLRPLREQARFLELDSRREIPDAESPFLRAARGEAFDGLAFWVDRPEHDSIAVTMSSRPLLLDGEFRGSIASIDDVTAYMRMLEDRDDFVALVSHELRTPLTSIAGFLELALDEELPDSLRSWLSIVQRNSERLRALVEDLLIVGEMSRGDVHLASERVDLRALAEQAVATLAHRARRRGVSLRLADGAPVTIVADARRIEQVIENLISNGIKYTRDDGSVEVHVEAEGADALVRVVDDGPGVAPAEAERVFERFYRSSSARASGVQGAGLGLWICRMIVHAHGGSIDFASQVGRGSTASFRLPLPA